MALPATLVRVTARLVRVVLLNGLSTGAAASWLLGIRAPALLFADGGHDRPDIGGRIGSGVGPYEPRLAVLRQHGRGQDGRALDQLRPYASSRDAMARRSGAGRGRGLSLARTTGRTHR